MQTDDQACDDFNDQVEGCRDPVGLNNLYNLGAMDRMIEEDGDNDGLWYQRTYRPRDTQTKGHLKRASGLSVIVYNMASYYQVHGRLFQVVHVGSRFSKTKDAAREHTRPQTQRPVLPIGCVIVRLVDTKGPGPTAPHAEVRTCCMDVAPLQSTRPGWVISVSTSMACRWCTGIPTSRTWVCRVSHDSERKISC